MRCSLLFNPTLKEDPHDAEVMSHRLLLRAGFMRKVSNGIFVILHLGLRSQQKFEAILRDELSKIGAQEISMPCLIPSELWEKSGRWEKYGPELLRISDRHDKAYCFGPTHEEVVTEYVGRQIKSYKKLPVNVYQIQTKFRDEIRPRFGLMRGREFVMKDGYSFHETTECLDVCFQAYKEAYFNVFERCGLSVKAVEADSGAIGGTGSIEFMVTAETGEDSILECDYCQFAGNIEAVKSNDDKLEWIKTDDDCVAFDTPAVKTIDELTTFADVSPKDCVKSVCYMGGETPYLILIRGDYELNDAKLAKLVPNVIFRKAEPQEIRELYQTFPGSIGPKSIGPDVVVIADFSIRDMKQRITGANIQDKHYKGLELDRDFNVDQWADLRFVGEKETCPECQKGTLHTVRGIEVGHIFKLGTVYSEPMEASFLNRNGKPQFFEMGCYGIGVGRSIAAAIEQSHDEFGMIWPKALAPYEVIVIPANSKKSDLVETSESIYNLLSDSGIDALLDDRDESPGVKFSEADLIGVPYQVIVGKRFQQERKVELKIRATGERITCDPEEVCDTLRELLHV